MWKTIIIFAAIFFVIFLFENEGGKEIILTEKAPKPIGPYSQGILSGKTLYVSGQVGFQSNGTLDSSSIENECRQALNNVKAIVEEAGMEMKDVVKATIYLTDIKNFPKVNEVYGTFFPEAPPARETVEVKALPKNAHIEISVIAH
jgi:2-iminobutanoate/2-iminopropanoate deaminase